MILDDRQPVSSEAYHKGKTILVDAPLTIIDEPIVKTDEVNRWNYGGPHRPRGNCQRQHESRRQYTWSICLRGSN